MARRAASLPTGEVALGRALVRLDRTGSDSRPFVFPDFAFGFVLKPLQRHEAAYGGDRRRTVPLAPGVGWLMPKGTDGHCSWDGASDFVNVLFEADLVREIAGGTTPHFAPRYAFMDPTASRIALDLLAADGSDLVTSLYRGQMTLALAAHLVRTLATAPPLVSAPPALDNARLARVVDHIEACPDGDLSLEALAGIAALSPFHFARAFKAAVGEPPHRFVMRRRIERAKLLLKTTSLPIAEVGVRTGWENPSHFAQAFRAITGATPGRWRAAA